MINLLKKNALLIQVLIFSVSMLIPPTRAQQQNTKIVQQQNDTIQRQLFLKIHPGHVPNETYIGDFDVPGTVRVNNLANLEATINIFANGFQLMSLICGFLLVLRSFMLGRSPLIVPILKWKLGGRSQFVLGCALMFIGLAIPGVINWFTASTDGEVFM